MRAVRVRTVDPAKKRIASENESMDDGRIDLDDKVCILLDRKGIVIRIGALVVTSSRWTLIDG